MKCAFLERLHYNRRCDRLRRNLALVLAVAWCKLTRRVTSMPWGRWKRLHFNFQLTNWLIGKVFRHVSITARLLFTLIWSTLNLVIYITDRTKATWNGRNVPSSFSKLQQQDFNSDTVNWESNYVVAWGCGHLFD